MHINGMMIIQVINGLTAAALQDPAVELIVQESIATSLGLKTSNVIILGVSEVIVIVLRKQLSTNMDLTPSSSQTNSNRNPNPNPDPDIATISTHMGHRRVQNAAGVKILYEVRFVVQDLGTDNATVAYNEMKGRLMQQVSSGEMTKTLLRTASAANLTVFEDASFGDELIISKPVVTVMRNAFPTSSPSCQPSRAPTTQPSVAPSSSPSGEPTSNPTYSSVSSWLATVDAMAKDILGGDYLTSVHNRLGFTELYVRDELVFGSCDAWGDYLLENGPDSYNIAGGDVVSISYAYSANALKETIGGGQGGQTSTPLHCTDPVAASLIVSYLVGTGATQGSPDPGLIVGESLSVQCDGREWVVAQCSVPDSLDSRVISASKALCIG